MRANVEKRSKLPDLRDVFLCHAWDDRKDAAKELHDLLESKGVTVWFSEKDVLLGSSLLREIDKGLAKSRVGIVLVTPSFLQRVKGEGIADKELSKFIDSKLHPKLRKKLKHLLLEYSNAMCVYLMQENALFYRNGVSDGIKLIMVGLSLK